MSDLENTKKEIYYCIYGKAKQINGVRELKVCVADAHGGFKVYGLAEDRELYRNISDLFYDYSEIEFDDKFYHRGFYYTISPEDLRLVQVEVTVKERDI